MSGGTFNYDQYRITTIADTIEHNIDNQGKIGEDGFSYEVLSPEVQAAFHRAIICLREAHIYAHRIDYLLAGDDSVGTFLKRLEGELAAVRCIHDVSRRFFFFTYAYWCDKVEGKGNLSLTSKLGFPMQKEVKQLAVEQVKNRYDEPEYKIKVVVESWIEMSEDDYKQWLS